MKILRININETTSHYEHRGTEAQSITHSAFAKKQKSIPAKEITFNFIRAFPCRGGLSAIIFWGWNTPQKAILLLPHAHTDFVTKGHSSPPELSR
ncbi:hypothetical protein EZS27_040072 [termite gut metagenome]|uniref:Uncharacterized protein n=1 Tax=termite gut metagenome TaxID=433724 RepID=A0A5J4PHA1_9ZZZZ